MILEEVVIEFEVLGWGCGSFFGWSWGRRFLGFFLRFWVGCSWVFIGFRYG